MGYETANALSNRVIGFTIEVHRTLGPGLLESICEECLCFDRGHQLGCRYQTDLIVGHSLLLEIKTVERIHPLHEAQLLTYLKLTGLSLGLLLNFNTPTLKDGIRRFRL